MNDRLESAGPMTGWRICISVHAAVVHPDAPGRRRDRPSTSVASTDAICAIIFSRALPRSGGAFYLSVRPRNVSTPDVSTPDLSLAYLCEENFRGQRYI